MIGSVPFVHSLVPVLSLGVFLSAGPTAPLTSAAPAYQSLAAGDYADAAELLAAMQAQAPHDPYVELDLGLAYQGIGRMDLAEPLYRKAMDDGKSIIPPVTTNASDAGKTVGLIACENMRIGFRDNTVC